MKDGWETGQMKDIRDDGSILYDNVMISSDRIKITLIERLLLDAINGCKM